MMPGANQNPLPGKRLALVVGAGGVKCAAALGLWKALQQAEIPIDHYIGCSGGSLFTALMALGRSLDEATTQTRQLWTRQVTARRDTPALIKALLPGLLKFDERFAMIDDRLMNRRLAEVFGELTFADCRTRFSVLATDFKTGAAVTLTQGKLFDALRASIAIPYIWSAWQVNDRLMIDGSFSNPLPVDIAILEGAEIILAMGFDSPYPRRVKSLSRFVFHLNSVMTNNLLKANFAFHNLAHHAEIIPVLPEFDREISLFDTQQIPYVIEQGEQAMEASLPYLRQLLA